MRANVEEMFERYPEKEKDGLRGRLRSDENNKHLSAFFELALHDFLLRQGCSVIAVEPELEHTAKSPDFLVETPQGGRFYLEATLAIGLSPAEAGADRRLRDALQAIDSIHSPDFFLELNVSGKPIVPLRVRRIRERIERWLSELDYQSVANAWSTGIGAIPMFRYEDHGVRFRIRPVPRRASRGTRRKSRAIGSQMFGADSVQPQDAVRRSILAKSTRYGQLDVPYVVAVNAMVDYADDDSVIDALFGTPAVFVRHTLDGFEDRHGRERDGVWRESRVRTNTRLSAVLSTEKLTPWSLGQRRARLVHNPWARHSFDSPFSIDVVEVQGNRLRRTEGASLEEVFELPDGWPE